jgi:hypothetical protein
MHDRQSVGVHGSAIDSGYPLHKVGFPCESRKADIAEAPRAGGAVGVSLLGGLGMIETNNPLANKKLCYVRPVFARDVREDIEREASEVSEAFADDSILYALHADDGSRIALMSDRDIAFAAARQHEMTPLSVH